MTLHVLRPLPWLAACLAVLMASNLAIAGTAALTGTVTYRERMALPPGAVVEVRLLDVSRAGAAPAVLAETRVTPEGQVPVSYRLDYRTSDIVPGGTYALQARITVAGRLWFISTERHPVFTGGPDAENATGLVVRRVPGAASPAGRWLVEDIRGGGVMDRLQTVLEIADDGAVSGTGGCNRMTGRAGISGEVITFGPIAATEMACATAVMDQEAKFFAALRDVRAWHADPVRRKLTLLDEHGTAVLVLARHEG